MSSTPHHSLQAPLSRATIPTRLVMCRHYVRMLLTDRKTEHTLLASDGWKRLRPGLRLKICESWRAVKRRGDQVLIQYEAATDTRAILHAGEHSSERWVTDWASKLDVNTMKNPPWLMASVMPDFVARETIVVRSKIEGELMSLGMHGHYQDGSASPGQRNSSVPLMQALWDARYDGPNTRWAANPDVIRITFERVKTP
jgi:hypothetical protein